MASVTTDATLISTVLDRLERLDANTYTIAFGPGGKQFLGTPNGYSATYLPSKVLAELAGCDIKRVLWASFGDAPESWFFVYEFKNGAIAIRLGPDAPRALHDYIEDINKSKELLGSLRAQLGNDGSFVVWSKSAWACRNVPNNLRSRLLKMSSGSREYNGVTMGSFKKSTLVNIAWHKDGSYFLRTLNNRYGWAYFTVIIRNAWDQLWLQDGRMLGPGLDEMAELAYVAIDAHAPTSDTFAFIKKQKTGETPFILHFGQEPIHARLSTRDRRLQLAVPKVDDNHFQWAVSTKAGRPHKDTWELELKKGQRVRVVRDMGRDWYVVVGKKDIEGWVHGSWLDFSERRFLEDPKTVWLRFNDDVEKMLSSVPLSSFPTMADYVDACTRDECMPLKGDGSSLGICAHDLQVLLEGHGGYCFEWVKTARNMWHPDRFARHCMPEYAESLKAKAEQLFVLHGVVMETF